MSCRNPRSRFIDQFFEPAVAEISKYQPRGAERILRNCLLDLRIYAPGDHKNIGKPVVIEINDPRSPRHKSRFDSDARANCAVLEKTFAIVLVQNAGIVRQMGLEDIEMPVEIIIADSNAHAGLLVAVFVQSDAGLEPNISERPVPVVSE